MMSEHTHADRVTPMHVGAGIYWTAATMATIANVWWGASTLLDILNILAFVGAEGWALEYRKELTIEGRIVALRDTLSEFMTWVARMSKPGTRWYQSWNMLVVVIAGHWSALPARQVDLFWAQFAIWLGMMGFLVYHWLRPDTKG